MTLEGFENIVGLLLVTAVFLLSIVLISTKISYLRTKEALASMSNKLIEVLHDRRQLQGIVIGIAEGHKVDVCECACCRYVRETQ